MLERFLNNRGFNLEKVRGYVSRSPMILEEMNEEPEGVAVRLANDQPHPVPDPSHGCLMYLV